jgi:hypothetical protein
MLVLFSRSRRRAILTAVLAVVAVLGVTVPTQQASATGCPPTAFTPDWDGFTQASAHALMNCTGSYTIRLSYYDTGSGTWQKLWETSGTASAGATLPPHEPVWVQCSGLQVRTWAYANVGGAGASDTSNSRTC